MKKRYGLIGYPLGHSFSRVYFTAKFNNEHIDADYDLFPLEDISQLKKLLEGNPDIAGLNVTIPHKQRIIPLLDRLSDEVSMINAVNVVKITRQNNDLILHGYNTDAPAFESELLEFTGKEPGFALVLGTGGAAAAVTYVLGKHGWTYSMVSRQPESGSVLSYNDLTESVFNKAKLIVNTTPLGMFPNTEGYPSIPYHLITSKHYLFDLVYNPETTTFLEKGSQQGANTRNGLGMLYKQAEYAWKIWQH